jgi:A/G-specific adenine glycosylase
MGIRQSLLSWYDNNRRALPWRGTKDPYHILVSEMMLQQTRAVVVAPYYERFLARFPDAATLARAREEDVLALWSGLGYYSRARNLKRAAAVIQQRFPATYDELLQLPGVGRYTAAAVASIAFDHPCAAVDGNVLRVLARLDAVAGNIRAAEVRQQLETRAQRLLDRRRPGDFNQALMDLGATVCTPGRPKCESCPLRRYCRAARSGLADHLPVLSAKKLSRAVNLSVALVQRQGQILFRQRPSNARLMPGFLELPSVEELDVRDQRLLGQFRHAITKTEYSVWVWGCKLRKDPQGAIWLTVRELEARAVTTISRKALHILSAYTQGKNSSRLKGGAT